jgi:hypothetical protein
MTQELRDTEARLRAEDADAYRALADAKRELETLAVDEREAYAEAALEGVKPTPSRSTKLRDQIRDIEKRVIPGIDAALWLLVPKVVEVVKPDADDTYRRQLDSQLKRWQPPDPKNPNVPAPTQHLKPRPKSVVDWVEHGVSNMDRWLAEKAAEDDREERKQAATRRVNLAQEEYNIEQRAKLDAEEEGMAPAAVMNRRIAESQSQPWPAFNRLAFLEREGLVEDYGWAPSGGVILANPRNREFPNPADSKEATPA